MTTFTSDYPEDFASELRANKASARIPREDAVTDLANRVAQMSDSGAGVTRIDLERYMGRNDLLRINYLQRGVNAAKAVCRIYIPDLFGAQGEWGTGFLITPRLIITNNHVIKDKSAAARGFAEFDFEADVNGRMKASKTFSFLPGECFITSSEDELDFTVIAVAEQSEDGSITLDNFGFLRMIPALNKIDEKEFVTIIQHPGGGEKYIAVRENEVLKIGDSSDPQKDKRLWYSSDTATGSSGAPVFNDQWQVVALHHSSVTESRIVDGNKEIQLNDGTWVEENDLAKFSDAAIKYIANEGIRTSKIIEEISIQHAAGGVERFTLIQQLLDDVNGIITIGGSKPKESIVTGQDLERPVSSLETLTDKVKVNLRDKKYYDGRSGFDDNFLGLNIGLPSIKNTKDIAAVDGAVDNVLRYTHYSVVYNKVRKMAFYAAVNIDGSKANSLNRGTDKWFKDPRIDLNIQVGDELYGSEPGRLGSKGYFDRGHLVRRLDPVWGDEPTSILANDDTFHWTNCSPQYWQFNQGQDLWQGLENYILYNTDQEDILANVYNGPIFSDDDQKHRGILIPKYFWKVVVVKDKNDQIFSSAYVVDQSKWATNIPFEIIPTGDFNHFQTTIKKLEKQTGLIFSDIIRNSDVRKDKADKNLRSLSDIDHPRR
ncbi:DNA/RNA non-specific endonuclease [Dyadobacter subterraneus]|uniref:DNA/RNA non-specific endonuclease n=1 Tax=Dyadobacter subterraneus TaxID=2773304 RepID=A0ABR9WB46_9BACT|nr:DNA/RNA non-specific endonuclease [Dyadobacter subterraneus]MBE9461571.1 DNA/RNA non-specific endonuclease [Dyadobacter subterraneus]